MRGQGFTSFGSVQHRQGFGAFAADDQRTNGIREGSRGLPVFQLFGDHGVGNHPKGKGTKAESRWKNV